MISFRQGSFAPRIAIVGSALLGIFASSASAQAPVAYSLTGANPSYSQNFDTLASSGTSSTVPSGFGFVESGTNANTTYATGTGSVATGDTYSFGASGSSERAFGGLQSGSLNPTLGAIFTNNTGATITSVTINYTGEMWRLGTAGRTDRLDFQYSTDATSLTAGNFTDVDALDFSTPDSSGTAGARVGNNAGYRTALSSTIELSLAPGATLTLRWNDVDASGADDGLAIDDFSLSTVTSGTVTPTATPTPTVTPTPTTPPTPQPTVAPGTAPTVVISQYRPSAKGSDSDEYIEIYNARSATTDISNYKIVAGTSNPGTTVFTFGAGTTLPPRSHFLLVGSGYSLTSVATKDGDLIGNLPVNGGVAILNSSGQVVDQVGVAGYLEGEGVSTARSDEYAYLRLTSASSGEPIDSDNNGSDFVLVSTSATTATGQVRLGTPGPQNLAAPIQYNGYITVAAATVATNRQGAPQGTLTVRRRITNTSGRALTSLRLRVVEASAGTGGTGADTRLINALGTTAPGTTLPNGTTAPAAPGNRFYTFNVQSVPTQPSTGAGLNVLLTPTNGPVTIPAGESADIEFSLNVQTGGSYRVVVNFEATLAAAN